MSFVTCWKHLNYIYVQIFLVEGSKDPASCSSAAVLPCASIQCFQKAREKSYGEITERKSVMTKLRIVPFFMQGFPYVPS